MTEQLALEQFLRQAGTTHRYKRTFPVFATIVNGPRKNAFASTTLTQQQHCGLSRSSTKKDANCALHRRILRGKNDRRILFIYFLLYLDEFRFQLALVFQPAGGFPQVLWRK